MKKLISTLLKPVDFLWNRIGLGIRSKMIIIFLFISVIPIVLLAVVAWKQLAVFGDNLVDTAAEDASDALNNIATENIERMTTDTAREVAEFLYARDKDILYIAGIEPSEESYRLFAESKMGRLNRKSEWILAPDGKSWVAVDAPVPERIKGKSSNSENNDMDRFHYRQPDAYKYDFVPFYDEITFIDLNGNELVKVVASSSPKIHYPLDPEKKNVSLRENTYVRAETYFDSLTALKSGEVYVSDVIGAYVGSNYIGMYVPGVVASAAELRGYDIDFDPGEQAYAGRENPNGQRFEGIIRWATPVSGRDGNIIGYVTFALNHDHIMEIVDHITPMEERYTELPSAFEGNYAFIWDYKCRSICHPRHHSIVGFNPETGDPQIPWLESSIYSAWQESGVEKWTDFIVGWPTFDRQSRIKAPAPALTRAGLVGLDGRYLNNAPQCTGWMDLTEDGGSGSFYILWSGLYKLTTAAAIPYYTGQYAPSPSNGYSLRGFGIVTIGAGLEDFTHPATEMGDQLRLTIRKNLDDTLRNSLLTSVITLFFAVLIAIRLASFFTKNITNLVNGVSRFRAGERQFRFTAPVKDEFGTLADAFDSMADNIEGSESGPVTITDMDHKIIYMNEKGLKMLNISLQEASGMIYSEVSLYPQGTKYDPVAAFMSGIESEAFFHEASQRYMKGVARYFLDENGNRIGFIISSMDVTEIQTAMQAADQASKAKGDFLSNMSHEIRTPLNAIIGMTAMGTSATDPGRKDYCLNKIDDASKHLLGVINDILDMSKIEANKLELSPTKFNFEKMLKRVFDVVGFRVDEKRQDLDVRVDKNIPLMIIADEQRLAQVITNLLSNAVKFTMEEGSIRLNAKLLSDEDGLCTIQIDVKDNGIGINEEQMSRMFNVFEQAERSTSRKFGGTGLGLAISKRIVEMMGGKIWIESELNKGSVFSFTVQAKHGHESKESLLLSGVSWENVRVIAVDDEPHVIEYFSDLSKQFNIHCDVAASGEDAMALIRKNGPYDLYFVDWKMPQMNGIELSKLIKNENAGNPVIVMISSTDWNSIEAEAKRAGVDRFLQKPLFSSAIAECINEYLGNPAEAGTNKDTSNFTGCHLLLAEDMEINREIVIAMLEPTNLEIDCAGNGEEAVKLFTENPERYDLVFMDLQMPEVDGFEATRRIRALDIHRAKNVPIIAMTANVFKEDIEHCLEAGMNDHVGKPLDFDEVLKRLQKYLPKNAG